MIGVPQKIYFLVDFHFFMIYIKKINMNVSILLVRYIQGSLII